MSERRSSSTSMTVINIVVDLLSYGGYIALVVYLGMTVRKVYWVGDATRHLLLVELVVFLILLSILTSVFTEKALYKAADSTRYLLKLIPWWLYFLHIWVTAPLLIELNKEQLWWPLEPPEEAYQENRKGGPPDLQAL